MRATPSRNAWCGRIEASEELERPVSGFTDDAARALVQYAWPGNVRELRNVVRRSVLIADGMVQASDLALPSTSGAADAERRAIRAALIGAQNKSEAARLLKTDFKTVHLKMRQLGISLSDRAPW